MTREEPKPNETARRAALLGMIVPAAALLSGCASRATTPAASAAAPTASPAIKGGLGAYALNPDGTRSFRDHAVVDRATLVERGAANRRHLGVGNPVRDEGRVGHKSETTLRAIEGPSRP